MLTIREPKVMALPLLAVSCAWVFVAVMPMQHQGAAYLVGWTVMVIAMMVPTVMRPMRRLANGSLARASAFLAGYIGVWMIGALPAFFLMDIAMGAPLLTGVAWVAAGIVQIAPGTAESLRSCSRLSTDGHPLRAGIRQGLWCQRGCLMVMIAAMATAMQLVPVAGVGVMVIATGFMFWEKWNRASLEQVRALGALFVLIGAAIIIAAPGLHQHLG
jgi:hypothetical protein